MMVWKIEHKENYHKITMGKSSWIITKKRGYDVGVIFTRSVYAFISIICAVGIGIVSNSINRGIYPTEFTDLSFALFILVMFSVVMCSSFFVVADSTTWTYAKHLKRKRERELKRKKAK